MGAILHNHVNSIVLVTVFPTVSHHNSHKMHRCQERQMVVSDLKGFMEGVERSAAGSLFSVLLFTTPKL